MMAGLNNWWRYRPSSDPDVFNVNPLIDPDEDDVMPSRRLSNYAYYLKLTSILDSQVPNSTYVDERLFIVVHQLLELSFKELIFDLHVIVSTVTDASVLPDDTLRKTLFSSGTPDWADAMVAARRIRYLAEVLVPTIVRLLDAQPRQVSADGGTQMKLRKGARPPDDYGVLFRKEQFMLFRKNLPPASGFQSAQVRLIQRAFGKANLLRMRVFDAYFYWENYAGILDRHELMRVDDPLILGLDVHIARPQKGTPEFEVSRLDDTILNVLSRLHSILALPDAPEPVVPPIGLSQPIVAIFKNIMATALHPPEDGKKTTVTAEQAQALEEQFANEIRKGCEKENARRNQREYRNSAPVYDTLSSATPKPDIVTCIENIVACDDALFGADGAFATFLQDHQQIVGRSGIELKEAGTAGGGRRYLSIAALLNRLFPVFPVLRKSTGV